MLCYLSGAHWQTETGIRQTRGELHSVVVWLPVVCCSTCMRAQCKDGGGQQSRVGGVSGDKQWPAGKGEGGRGEVEGEQA